MGLRRVIILSLLFILSQSVSGFAETYLFYENRHAASTSPSAYPESKTREMMPLDGKWRAILPDGSEATISVPSAFDFSGKVRFEKKVELPRALEKRHFKLICEGINNHCEIFVNDQFIKFHAVSGAAFQVDIANEFLRFGQENKITIVADSRLDPIRTIPIKAKAYSKKNYGGIFRDIFLVAEPEIILDDADVNYEIRSDTLNLDLLVKIKTYVLSSPNMVADSKVTCSFRMLLDSAVVLNEPNLFTFKPEQEQILQETTHFNVPHITTWSPAYPALYRMEFVLRSESGSLLDSISLATGFRKIDIQNGVFHLNGIPAELKGVNLIEEGYTSANALSRQNILNDIKLVKGLGANAIRFKEAPSPIWPKLCDSLGIFVILDEATSGIPSEILGQKSYAENAELYLRELIDLTKFNPSVIAYGFGTGIDLEHEGTEKYLSQLYRRAKERSKNFTFFSPKYFVKSSLYKYGDFIGATLFNESFSTSQEQLDAAAKFLPSDKSLIVTEYGAAAEPGNHNGYSDPRSLEYQAKYFLDHYKYFKQLNKNKPLIAGSFVYSLADYHYAIPPISCTHYKDIYLASYGLTRLDRERKMSYDMVKSLYADERVYNPPIGKFAPDFSPSLILVATLLTAALVFILNENHRIRENLVRAMVRPFHLFIDIRDMRISSLLEPILLLSLLSLLWGSILAAILFSVKDTPILEEWLSHVIGGGSMRSVLNFLILEPALATLIYGILFFVLSGLLCWLINAVLYLVGKKRVTFTQILNLWTWASVHWIVLIFIAAFIDRLESPKFTLIIFLVSIVFIAMSFFRTFKGLAIVTNQARHKVYIAGFVTILVILLGSFYLYDQYNFTTAYMHYWRNVAGQ
ncbi:glycoside hydrolase family 2 sugar binding [Chloroherpeton thalassium ATCC 35110]|uniref:Glycoside hydrolase family 2 sugar binding n=1 Tax=Chloroherpeton thalassium (strain ATCC 35110 / GB-78) TaxID=517418 RepID=B3QRZ5_CHLT3|nr:glycoside hydrolase family 2 [Chloroherpeton thalassium]ACF12480.1 glycoside hydrolase family 2 sugar binding [Chloroherpeton thalassium ATCC 35110]